MLWRLAPGALFGGIALAVVGLSKLHASQLGTYDYSGSSRFAWSLAYIGILAVAAYSVGLPDVPRNRRSAVITAVAAAVAGALGMSIVQLLVGDALLPRFVVLRQRPAARALVPAHGQPGPRRPLVGRASGPGRGGGRARGSGRHRAECRTGSGRRDGRRGGGHARARCRRGDRRRRSARWPISSSAERAIGRGPRPRRPGPGVGGRPGRGAPRGRRPGPHAVALLRGVAGQAARSASSSGCR